MSDITTTDTTPDTPIAGDAAPSASSDTEGLRQCARCRLHFPIEAGTHAAELLDWWTCPTCTDALLPGRRRAAGATD